MKLKFKFLRISNGGDERKRLSFLDKNGNKLVVLFVSGELSLIKKQSTTEFPSPSLKGTLIKSQERIVKGTKEFRSFAIKVYSINAKMHKE